MQEMASERASKKREKKFEWKVKNGCILCRHWSNPITLSFDASKKGASAFITPKNFENIVASQ